ncbi:MAG TPA: preprotein translocase subunit SecE [Pyrinomonadaceae bacterium]|jgi:preprotein translocase subunit SecE|nr:preprotein translocase subunit SecE [Pyrinomonadaceae bacterium]
MAETENPDAPMVAPRTARFGEGPEGKVARRERGQGAQQHRPGRFVQFLHDVRAEMRRVSWPSVKEIQNTTIITLIAVVFFALYLFLVDTGMTQFVLGLQWLLAKIAGWLGFA